jgi:hypothetical protein
MPEIFAKKMPIIQQEHSRDMQRTNRKEARNRPIQ